MTRRATWCRCCGQPSASTRCEPCGLTLAAHDGRTAAVIRSLFGEEGWIRFTVAMRADRVKASRARRTRRKPEQPSLIPAKEITS